MSGTEIKSSQIKDGEVKRADLNTSTTGSAVVTKLVAGTGISFSSTGVDAGTGDVTITAAGGTAAGSTGQVQYNASGSLAGENTFYYDASTNQLALGNSTPITDLTITKSVGLDGSNPLAITLHSTNNSGSWTAGARVASLDYYSDDLSGTGNTPGVRNRIAFESSGTTGGAYNLNIYGDAGAGLFSQLRMTKDGFNQFNGNTGAAALCVSPLSTNVSTCVIDGIASQSQNVFRVRDSSSGALFDVALDGKVGIGNSSPAKVLDVTSTTSGMLPPRMTTTQRDAIGTPVAGELIYNSTNARLEGYINSAWKPLAATPYVYLQFASATFTTSDVVYAGVQTYNSDTGVFSWNDGSDLLTLLQAGTYEINFNLDGANSGNAVGDAILKLFVNGSFYTQSSAGFPVSVSGGTGGCQAIIEANANDTLQWKRRKLNGSSATIAAGTNLVVKKIK